MVSVVIPVYNRETTIERAIMSVLNQTYTDLEVIVVDDCSTDSTREVVKNLNDNRVRLISLKQNSGACCARNCGIDVANGEYIAFQDSDDEWLPNKIQLQLEEMKKNDAAIAFCQFSRLDSDGVSVAPILSGGFISRDKLIQESYVSTQTLIGKRECFIDIRFDTKMPRLQDYDICIRLSEKFDFYFVKQPLVNMYVQDDSISMNFGKLETALELIFTKYPDIIKKNKNMDFYQSRYLAYAKEHLGIKSHRERFHCFTLKPSWKIAKKVIKSAISK